MKYPCINYGQICTRTSSLSAWFFVCYISKNVGLTCLCVSVPGSIFPPFSLIPPASSPPPLPPGPAMNQWAALCKALPGTTDGTSPWTKCKDDFEAIKVKPTSMPYVQLDNPVSWEDVVAMDVETAPPLFALALGCGNRIELEIVYQNMMDYARHKGERLLPQMYTV